MKPKRTDDWPPEDRDWEEKSQRIYDAIEARKDAESDRRAEAEERRRMFAREVEGEEHEHDE